MIEKYTLQKFQQHSIHYRKFSIPLVNHHEATRDPQTCIMYPSLIFSSSFQ